MWKQMQANVKRKREQRKQNIAHELWQRRIEFDRGGNQETDWKEAEQIVRSPLRRLGFHLNQYLIWMEKAWFEPADRLLSQAAFFNIVDRLSPALEAIGVLLIPLVLYFATQSYEERKDARELQRLQQEAVEDYISQITNVLLSTSTDLHLAANERMREVISAATITKLQDPNLDGERKRQIIDFLVTTNLVQGHASSNVQPIVSLSRANLNYANLNSLDLSGANLSNASFRNTRLSQANLNGANLSGAKILNVNFLFVNLKDANFSNSYIKKSDFRSFGFSDYEVDLSGANFSGAYLINTHFDQTDFSGANFNAVYLADSNLNGINLSGADLRNADLNQLKLKGADLSQTDLSNSSLLASDLSQTNLSQSLLLATNLRSVQGISPDQLTGENSPYLCKVALPQNITDVDPNRDCDLFPQLLVDRYENALSLEESQQIVEEAEIRLPRLVDWSYDPVEK